MDWVKKELLRPLWTLNYWAISLVGSHQIYQLFFIKIKESMKLLTLERRDESSLEVNLQTRWLSIGLIYSVTLERGGSSSTIELLWAIPASRGDLKITSNEREHFTSILKGRPTKRQLEAIIWQCNCSLYTSTCVWTNNHWGSKFSHNRNMSFPNIDTNAIKWVF